MPSKWGKAKLFNLLLKWWQRPMAKHGRDGEPCEPGQQTAVWRMELFGRFLWVARTGPGTLIEGVIPKCTQYTFKLSFLSISIIARDDSDISKKRKPVHEAAVNISSCAAVKVAASFADFDALESGVLYPSPSENHEEPW
eukprot:s518_g2.t1